MTFTNEQEKKQEQRKKKLLVVLPKGHATKIRTVIIGIRRPLVNLPIMFGWFSHVALLVINYPDSNRNQNYPSIKSFCDLDVEIVELKKKGTVIICNTKVINCVQNANNFLIDGVQWTIQPHINIQFGKKISARTVCALMQRCFNKGGSYTINPSRIHTCHQAQACTIQYLSVVAAHSWH